MDKPVPILRSASSESNQSIQQKSSGDSTTDRKVSFAAKARVSGGSKDETDDIIPTKREGTRTTTAETFSDVSSATSGESGGLYEVIEYDPASNMHSPMSPGLDEENPEDFMGIEPAIGENTPAAEALRASAAVKVSRVGKAARAVNIQAVRKLVKRATGTSKHGHVKGKPPRLPPQHLQGEEMSEVDEDESMDEQINEAHIHQPPPSPEAVEKGHLPDDVVAGTVEAGQRVLDAVDKHDMLKVVRFRKKNKGEDKKPKSYCKGKVIDGEHELYTLSIAVMIGVRTSISKTNIVINSGPSKRWVLPQDYRTTEKYEFRPKGGTGMPSHQLAHTFKFKDYAPVVFAYLRRMYGINEFDFLISVCGNANFIEFISNAKSGQFFFYSSDGRYMIKTMTNAECKFLRRILPDYFKHCSENPNTMITRFFGMYRVKLYHLRRNVKFVIMNSVYYTDKYLQAFYDLKGSSVGRDAKPGQAVKKDNDLRHALPDSALSLPPDTRDRVRKQLISDTEFLERMGIMDYSMLVGVHHRPPADDRSIAKLGYRTSTRKSQRRLATDPDVPSAENDSSRKLMTPRQASNPSLRTGDDTPRSGLQLSEDVMMMEDGLDDDDSSYLKGSRKRGTERSSRVNEETEQKKQATIEKLYWPFHRLFDIFGHRRLNEVQFSGDDEAADECLQGFDVKGFEAPLSDRKDGGFEMDTTGLSLPLIYKGDDGSNKLYEGKIFYMGIIDILQEYNSRKLLEAQYRLLQSSGRAEASCVDPGTYGHRFISFFDEYTQSAASSGKLTEGVEMTLDLHESTRFSPGGAPPLTPNQSVDSEDLETPQIATPSKKSPARQSGPISTPNGGNADALSVLEPIKKSSPSEDSKGTHTPRQRLFSGRRKNT
mmetsp:Transcript_15613/g.34113  ORF Transcript_15613/g.34113 Transcript_15613/m.34113 type:complete len:881 (+) Transcript_15613:196-2838(+)